ncbi:unnamed protein product [Mytilus coruscus]|uniref:Mutator-like transposase domain-containing protein n=1 Tax=Mytilus coruscus TaxID=42192 RepID=A0A6J7ZWI9_MYTCO|nr:unnamed protein product [Mytilus coruscus]
MADDKYSHRVRGKMASTGRSKKADRMRQMNRKETLRGEDHDYGAVLGEGPVSVNATDLQVGKNVELGPSKPWFQGRRDVELDVLARSMNCEKCNSWLRLSDIKDEVIYGMASFLYISCPSSACQHISLVPTGKKSNGKGFDINYKVCLAMINAGMGPSHVNNFLTGCNIPPVDASTFVKKEGTSPGKNEPKPPHECNVNWTGSSKGMEPDMACSMIQRLAEDGYTVGTLHADNDATTQSRLPRSIIKKMIKHMKKKISPNVSMVFQKLQTVKVSKSHPLHSEVFYVCYFKTPKLFKHLPNGKALSGDKLKEELDKLAQSYIERADRLLNLGSTQSN